MIIGICGRAQVGKDTVGKMINTMAYQRFEIRKFADELKYMTRILLNCTIEQLESIEYKNTPIAAMGGKTPRKIMQLLGTDFGRHMITQDVWVNALMMDYKKFFLPDDDFLRLGLPSGDYPKWIITDVRFPNEVRAIKERGGLLIRVMREATVDASHASETSLDDINADKFDYTIVNNGTLNELNKQVREILLKEEII